ncbi:HEAT repeat domain-containing protein [Chryseolinea sp. H1M3-3]|uniref:HEAT repeat domain-containing protein n=1 Tax=Chryseolinea sp. H1M3-3 TaxID=3034144 RepID=UPI0023EBF3D9|nr:HEAT repeat domain-containing protein [Chryseolinea sp. H1M3-3]
MEAKKIHQLLIRFNSGVAEPAEIKQIENLIVQGAIHMEDIEGFEKLNERILNLETPEPSISLDDRFHQMLLKETQATKTFDWKSFFTWKDFAPRLAFASVTLLIGLIVGYVIWSPQKEDEKIVALGQEISGLKEMMMLSLLEKESATDRLKAVNLTQDMDQASKKVTAALLQTLNSDENVNVRLAALDALRPYSKDGQIREALIRSIAHQKSPLVQVALAELMAALQEKGAINELQKILDDNETPSDIKKKIQESIQII